MGCQAYGPVHFFSLGTLMVNLSFQPSDRELKPLKPQDCNFINLISLFV